MPPAAATTAGRRTVKPKAAAATRSAQPAGRTVTRPVPRPRAAGPAVRAATPAARTATREARTPKPAPGATSPRVTAPHRRLSPTRRRDAAHVRAMPRRIVSSARAAAARPSGARSGLDPIAGSEPGRDRGSARRGSQARFERRTRAATGDGAREQQPAASVAGLGAVGQPANSGSRGKAWHGDARPRGHPLRHRAGRDPRARGGRQHPDAGGRCVPGRAGQ